MRYDEFGEYISQKQFEKLYIKKKKIMPHLSIGSYIQDADMIRIVPIQAPSSYTADIKIRKGSRNLQVQGSLPVSIKKTNIDDDYPYLTRDPC